jgi:hypothetical protein
MPRTALIIRVDCDEDDFDWLRNKCEAAVQNACDEAEEEGRLDGPFEVSWEQEDTEG